MDEFCEVSFCPRISSSVDFRNVVSDSFTVIIS